MSNEASPPAFPKANQSAATKVKGLTHMPSKLDTKLTPTFNKAASPPRSDPPPAPALRLSPPSPGGGSTPTPTKPRPVPTAAREEFRAKLKDKFNSRARNDRDRG